MLLYYRGRPERSAQYACVAESRDGIHFTRPEPGLYEFGGSKQNNIIWHRGASGHNFTPFKDPNPDAPSDQRFKAEAYYPQGKGLGAYASADGIHWRMLTENRIIDSYDAQGIIQGKFDSQNLAFWDAERGIYVCYYRGPDPRGLSRGIWRAVSEDFINWTNLHPIDYTDDRKEHMYTNAIRPYYRAPHIYIGMPGFIQRRKKVPEHPVSGISDGVLMSSRDGKVFDRLEEGFVRPGSDPQEWTDRCNYPVWGMVQSSPSELSIYWNEHYRNPTEGLRRGTLRVDGFVSVHAGGTSGEPP